MKVRQMRKFLSSDHGFTLAEMLVALLIVCFCFQLVIGVIQQTLDFNEHLKDTDLQEWHLALSQLEYYLNDPAIEIANISNRSIKFYTEEKGSKPLFIRRDESANFGIKPGHQPFLMNVRLVTFTREGYYLCLKIDLINGKTLRGRIYFPKYFKEEGVADENNK